MLALHHLVPHAMDCKNHMHPYSYLRCLNQEMMDFPLEIELPVRFVMTVVKLLS